MLNKGIIALIFALKQLAKRSKQKTDLQNTLNSVNRE